jgi:Ca-activated chloride channel family protein
MSGAQWTLDNPEFLLLFLLLVPLYFIRHIWRRRGGKLTFAFTNWQGKGFSNPLTFPALLYVISLALSWAGIVLIIIALAGPSRVTRERVFTSRGIDIMFVIDISPSMAARDFIDNSRLESAQETILRFVDRRKNDPIGLAIFGSQAALRVPPTLDYDYLKQAVDGLQVLELGEGTALGMGIALGALHLRNSTAREKVMVLLTDGESNAGEILPEAAARIAAEAGIRVYVIGIGSDREVLLEFTDPRTGKPYRATYQGSLEEDLLRGIAETTGGEYFTVTNPGSLNGVLLSIDSLERVETRLKVEVRKEPVHRMFILLAFIMIFADYLIRKMLLRELL